MMDPSQLVISRLGPCNFPSPLKLASPSSQHHEGSSFIHDDARVLIDDAATSGTFNAALSFERAGPRERLFFDAAKTRVGVVTCGGLCPGLNNVVRAIVLELFHLHGIREILGFRFGFEGLVKELGETPIPLGPEEVRNLHTKGGSWLGLGRGRQDVGKMVDGLVEHFLDILFVVGGDGSLRGAHAIAEEVQRRGLKIAVVAVPKSIDNDVAWIDKTFGFDSAIEIARQAIDAAHTEATGARHGIGLVKLMGRDSGFIAAQATLASNDVNFCLVPEVPFSLDGERGLLASLETRLRDRGHAVIVVAEGCASQVIGAEGERDASGNLRYASEGLDVGPRLRDKISSYFKERKVPHSLKYIDPSYMIRSVPANASDSVYCDLLGRYAVHAALSGRTDMVVGRWHGSFTHVPIALATSHRKQVDPASELWLSVLQTTGQGPLL
ncbi:MAG: ATP-dependent 6-phosphofructokinase [Polyangiaceae bacterium]